MAFGLFDLDSLRADNKELFLAELKAAKRVLDDLVAQVPAGTIEVRSIAHGVMFSHISIIDETAVVVPYLSSVTNNRSPAMIIKGETSGLFRVYKQEFEHMWANAVTPPQPPANL